MRMSHEFSSFYRLINAVDVIDAAKNEIIVWASTDTEEHQVVFTAFGKARVVKMKMLECDSVVINLFSSEGNASLETSTLEGDTQEYFNSVAERLINFLKAGDM